MSKHTPGPWMFGIRGDEKPIEKPFDYCGPGFYDNPAIFGSDGNEVVGCDEYMIFNSEADVRLIAAAPDLLEVLLWWQEQMRNDACDDMGKLLDAMSNKASAAIAKATGETK